MAGGPTCPTCFGQEWHFVEHVEVQERWPVVRGEIIYSCARCGRRAIRSWVDPHATDTDRRQFRDSWEFPEPQPPQAPPPGGVGLGQR